MSKHIHISRKHIPFLVAILGLIATIAVSIKTQKSEHQYLRTRFETASKAHAQALENHISNILGKLTNLQAFDAASQNIDPDEFHKFAKHVISRSPGTQAFKWTPKVYQDERTAHENSMRQWLADYQITENVDNGTLSSAKHRNYYFPITYAEPLDGNLHVIGYDLASNTLLQNAINNAERTGKITISKQIKLTLTNQSAPVFLSFCPIYKKSVDTLPDRHATELKGFMIGVYHIDNLVQAALSQLPSSEFDFSIYDMTSSDNVRIYNYQYQSSDTNKDNNHYQNTLGLSTSIPFTVADRQWSVSYTPTELFFKHYTHRHAVAELWVGLSVTSLLTLYLFRMNRRTEKIERMRKRAEEASIAKDQFMANMSHELRTPLNGVIGMTELLMNTPLDESQRRFAEASHSSGKALLELINSVLDFAKIEAGHFELNYHNFDLEQLIIETMNTMALQAQEKGLELVYFIDPNAVKIVNGDSTRLRQIIINLVGNALKFTKHGEVIIRVKQVDTDIHHKTTYQFSISDTGIGIPEDRVELLFQSFSQVDSSISRKYGGTGLGLAICKYLTNAMGGDISVDSIEGAGSTFRFTVQLKDIESSRLQSIPPDRLKQLNALVVDSSDTYCKVIHDLMAKWGISCKTTNTIADGQQILYSAIDDKQPFDLVLIDQNLYEDEPLLGDQDPRDNLLSMCLHIFLMGANWPATSADKSLIAGGIRKPVNPSLLLDLLTNSFCNSSNLLKTETNNNSETSSENSESDLCKHRILLAEDNLTGQMYVSEVLRRAGYTCDVVSNGREAVEAVQSEQYDLVLMDCQMPELDGFKATTLIRQQESKHVDRDLLPIIALTANALKGDRERCIAAGMDDYLTKPVEVQTLLDKIEILLGNDHPESADSEVNTQVKIETTESSCPFDPEIALQRCMNDAQFLAATLDSFAADMPKCMVELEQHLAMGNAENVTRVAHSIKGAAGMVTAEALRNIAEKIETLGKADQLDEINKHVHDLKNELTRCLEYIRDRADLEYQI